MHGGLDGHPVNLITADDGSDPSTALSELHTFVEKYHVIAIVANANILTEPSTASYLDQVRVPSIGGDDTVPTWFTNPMFFPSGPDSKVILNGALRYWVAKGDTKVGVFACVEYSLICSNDAQIVKNDAASDGADFVWSGSGSLAQPDFTSACLSAKAAGANVLDVAFDPASIARFANNCAVQGYHPAMFGTSLQFDLQLENSNTVGWLGGSPAFPFMVNTPATASFLQAAAAHLPAKPTAADVLAGLYTINHDTFGGLTPPLTYTTGKPTTTPLCYYLFQYGSSGPTSPDGVKQQCLPSSYANGMT
jgi:branched-chain amino acid transport system substrate-binding protein